MGSYKTIQWLFQLIKNRHLNRHFQYLGTKIKESRKIKTKLKWDLNKQADKLSKILFVIHFQIK